MSSTSVSSRKPSPQIGSVSILVNVGSPAAVRDRSEVQAAARTLGLEVADFEAVRARYLGPISNAESGAELVGMDHEGAR